jgi:hypothetical protein
MANIEIRGFIPLKATQLKQTIDEILQKIGLADDAITSICSLKAQSCDSTCMHTPYLRICFTDSQEMEVIIRSFQEHGVHEDVEWLQLNGFMSKQQMKAGVPPSSPRCNQER